MCSELRRTIKKLGDEFSKNANSCERDAMSSRPRWTWFYCDLASEYFAAADACYKYCDNLLNLLELVRELKHLGFSYCFEELIVFINDPVILNEINADEL
jgi:hypothetical protein